MQEIAREEESQIEKSNDEKGRGSIYSILTTNLADGKMKRRKGWRQKEREIGHLEASSMQPVQQSCTAIGDSRFFILLLKQSG